MRLEHALTDYFFSKDFTPRTRDEYQQKLDAWAAWLATHTCPRHAAPATDVEQVDITHLREYLDYVRRQPSKTSGRPITGQTVHGHARVLKAFLRWCVKEGLVAERVVTRMEMPRREKRVIAVFTPEHIQKLLAACERPKGDRYAWMAERDRAIIMTLLDTGLRATELCTLKLRDVHLGRDDSYIKVFGKGRKEREIGLGVKARLQLHRWMHRYRPPCDSDAVFISRERQPLTKDGLDALFERLQRATRITGVRCSPHDFRHTWAYNFVASGGDVARLSRLAGHTSLAVTSGYLEAFGSREARRGAVSVLDTMTA